MSASAAARPRPRPVLIVDDHPLFREGLVHLLQNERDLVVCGEAGTATEALALVQKLRPALVLLDISLPDRNGLELIKDLHLLQPQLPVLVISMHDESLHAERVLRAGARGYIMKQEGGGKILEAIRKVLAGQIYVSPKMSALILEHVAGQRPRRTRSPIERLTDREFEVFSLLGRGLATRDIARRLHLSVKTVEVHRLNIKRKLGLRNATELVSYAVRWVETADSSP
ncbi:MAG: response regulator transcription factor [Verrucomicrobiae bacterium]|nr:response regulator transcription factor [Verrucomicrobiae bacterium]MDW8308958.1 response regulator transcription factor [Verrucomicrobiales bacterium]